MVEIACFSPIANSAGPDVMPNYFKKGQNIKKEKEKTQMKANTIKTGACHIAMQYMRPLPD